MFRWEGGVLSAEKAPVGEGVALPSGGVVGAVATNEVDEENDEQDGDDDWG